MTLKNDFLKAQHEENQQYVSDEIGDLEAVGQTLRTLSTIIQKLQSSGIDVALTLVPTIQDNMPQLNELFAKAHQAKNIYPVMGGQLRIGSSERHFAIGAERKYRNDFTSVLTTFSNSEIAVGNTGISPGFNYNLADERHVFYLEREISHLAAVQQFITDNDPGGVFNAEKNQASATANPSKISRKNASLKT